MIKLVLVVYAITTQGDYVREAVGQFKYANLQYCRDVGTQLVQRLEQREDLKAVTFRCIEITDT